MMRKQQNWQYFLNNLPLKKVVWDRTKLWEIKEEKGRRFYHLLFDRIKNFFSIPGEITPAFFIAFSTLNKVFKYLIVNYFNDKEELKKLIFKPSFKLLIKNFIESYPPQNYSKDFKLIEFLKKNDSDILRRTILYEFLILQITEENPALYGKKELFLDENIVNNQFFKEIFKEIEKKYASKPYRGTQTSLIDLLREPIKSCPYSIYEQLRYVKERWRYLIPLELIEDIILSLDIIKEYETERPGGKGPTEVLNFKREDHNLEPERFTPDMHWMPQVVLLAKLVYVWLYQLSKKYSREIKRLDEIPDEELDLLQDFGFNALWLIGIWERSPASKKIKHLTGNLSAYASAYSIYDYQIAEDLGGEPAFNNLKERAFKRNIRLASDMVPNHTGIYSKWILDHPDWFIQTNYPPFPKYSFTKYNLSDNPDIEIYIEDGYFDRTDASVVFKLVDKRDGRIRYIYHGNDGTSIPWNDTAQLNYLRKDVREAVIQTILYVAQKTPIIRFDAAMTLTKRHYQRLWFPMPGQGGSIPSRAEYSISKEEFDRLMPEEFWREVVDRVSKESPDTLLLAEAFWLLEGYFVRSLGMHRVYNSAFMNMLKNEENEKYRHMIKNILHFEPEILKRFVNFMSNPDEKTAIEQFGTGDKYLGVCTLLVTMPGLPMFAHGQIEGFREKYGMEFYQSYWDEKPDENLIELHKKYIFPLTKKRYLFCESENFYLYDFITENGVDEDVFAYSNSYLSESAIIIYNNRYKNTKGFIKTSCEKKFKNAPQTFQYQRKEIYEVLNFKTEENIFYLFQNMRNNKFYLAKGADLKKEGLFFELNAYECLVFLNPRELIDTDGTLSIIYQNFKNKFFDDFEQLYLETKNYEKLNTIYDFINLKFSETDKTIHIFSDLFPSEKEAYKDAYTQIEGVLKEFELNLVMDFNYKLVNLAILNHYLKFLKIEILDFFDKLGANKFLYKKEADSHLYLQILRDLLNNNISFDYENLKDLLQTNNTVQRYIHLHNYEGTEYFNKERFEDLISAMYILNMDSQPSMNKFKRIVLLAQKCGYDFDAFIKTLIPEGRKGTES